ncbi:hypothetical protein NQS96_06450 [Pseudoalteromonas shioyasakiensis]|uniref:hypothetical protein n=1 Tax=Pseudoalteromonas shioyasakiensis TaxID=1190813 RepID=UPI002117C76A|nr:hypothetical protein [Pseudoalteromonas shioyasakiensis]MCQ8881445.1 hypothetical protein [Pseudoalteromonas shioyasakiensis]
MSKDNQKEKIPNVFNYKYFQLAFAVPLVLGFILMIFIWQNDNLSLEWPSKKTLEIFLSYMSVPLWIMGSAIPLATLATANFRAIQFQENLEYQKRNLERQEFEHALDLYHKELNIFTACFNSVLLNEEYKIIKGSNATLIYSKAFSKPTPNSTTSKCINTNFFRLILFFQEKMIKAYKNSLDSIEKFHENVIFTNMLSYVFISEFSRDEIFENLKLKDNSIPADASSLISFLLTFDSSLEEIASLLGVAKKSVKTNKLCDVVSFYIEICGLIRIFEDSGFYLSDEEINEINKDSTKVYSRQKHEDVKAFTNFLRCAVEKIQDKGDIDLNTLKTLWSTEYFEKPLF